MKRAWQDFQSQQRRLEGSIQAIFAFWLHKSQVLEDLRIEETIDPLDCLNEGMIMETCRTLIQQRDLIHVFWKAAMEDEAMAFILAVACLSWGDNNGGHLPLLGHGSLAIQLNMPLVKAYILDLFGWEIFDAVKKSRLIERNKSEIVKERRRRRTVQKVMDR